MKTYSRHSKVFSSELNTFCRLCLNQLSPSDLLPIFNEEQLPDLQLKIITCLGFEVIPEELLPNMICVSCFQELENFYIFKKKCEITNQILEARFKAVKDDIKKSANSFSRDSSLEQNNTTIIEEIRNEISNSIIQSNNVPEHTLILHNTVEPVTEDTRRVHIIENINQVTSINLIDKNCVTDTVQDVVVPDEISKPTEAPPQIQNECDENTFSVLAEELVKAGVLEVNNGTLEIKHENNGLLQLEMSNGALVTLQIDVESETEEENEAITVSLPAECVKLGRTSRYENVHCHQNLKHQDTYLKQVQRHQKPCKSYTSMGCDVCGKRFPSRSALARHRRVHSGERPYRCPHCPRTFTQKEVMLRHTTLHRDQKPFVCSQCPKGFTQRMGLVMHERSHTPPSARPLNLHRCQICPKVFLHASGLSRHQMFHEGRVFTCTECRRNFVDKSSLRRHLQSAHPISSSTLQTDDS